jgi:two-component system chemotaxis sensor kinase CheA
MENLLGEIRTGRMGIDRELVDILLSANDCLKTMIRDIDGSPAVDISDHLARLSAKMEGASPDVPEIVHNAGGGLTDLEGAIEEAVSRGQRAYIIDAANLNGNEIVARVKTIGQVAAAITPGGQAQLPDEYLFSESGLRLLITTVLDESLLPVALDIAPEKVVAVEGPDQLHSLAKPLPEATAPWPDPPSEPGPDGDGPEEPAVLPCQTELNDAQAKKSTPLSADETVRVHISLLNDLLDLASEMVLGRNQLLRILDAYRKDIPGINAVLQNIDGITTELQEKIMQTRMQPVAKVFNKFPRILRELSQKMGKEISLQVEGAGVELDKSIIEALGDPITHLVRNAVDHGIESPETREAAGKPRMGKIALKAYHEGGHVNIDITDDGTGIDTETIKRTALARGIIAPSEIPLMGEREFLELLFRPGFSTAERITDVSGRGVGMDVVKTNIERLGGTMEIMTTPGRSTTFRLILPITLAIISSLIVEVEGKKFALPQVNLQGLIRIKPGDYTRKIERIRDSDVLRYRGKLLPIIHLAEVLGSAKGVVDTEKTMRVLVIKSGSKLFGLVVDTIHDGEEILVKPLPRFLRDCQCYSGVTIMGDGRTAMILDPEGLIARAGLRFTDELKEMALKEAQQQEDSLTERQSLLLFKCAGPETLGIDLSMVARVEKIDAGRLERIGDREYIQFRGEAIRIIRPENYLPITGGAKGGQKLYVIIPKLAGCQMGVLIEKIIDTMEAEIKFNADDMTAKGLVGSAILDRRIVLIVNLYELFEMAEPKKLRAPENKGAHLEKTVLLAEDTPFFIKMEKKYLESAGYKVITALNGKEAWKILQENTVDAVVTDIEMPLWDGYELVRKIRADFRLGNLPVIAVTSRADQGSFIKGMEAGFDFYEVKLDRERLLEKLAMAFEKRSAAV